MDQKPSTRQQAVIQSVNYHLLQPCNMMCSHCYDSNLSRERLSFEDALKIVRLLARAGFEKLNFAGGEPMLHPDLDRLITEAKSQGMTTSVVTNGSMITDEWLSSMCGHLDWIALSIDSVDSETNMKSGRATTNGTISANEYLQTAKSVKQHGIRLKINTVVNSYNHGDDMSWFIKEAEPKRWKIMQSLVIVGQNDGRVHSFQATADQFRAYVRRHESVEREGITMVSEDNDAMTGSYAMIDPLGRNLF